MKHPNIVLMIFVSGKMVLIGGHNPEAATELIKIDGVVDVLLRNLKNMMVVGVGAFVCANSFVPRQAGALSIIQLQANVERMGLEIS
ncbi:importin subunit alpha-9-like protein [Tanacetum coccineum]